MFLPEEMRMRRQTQNATGPASRRRIDTRFISDEPLVPYDKHIRRELGSLSAEVLRRISKLSGDALEDAATLANGYQETALIATYLDRPDEARLICHAALDAIAERAETHENPTILLLGLGPLLELARLDARLGRVDEALFVLEKLSGLLRGQGLSFGALTISASFWEIMASGEDGPGRALASSIAVETLRALVASGRYEAALDASRVKFESDAMLEGIRREAHFVSLCRLGRAEEALLLAPLWATDDHPIRRAIFEHRHAEALAAFGDPIQAHAMAEENTRRMEARLGAGPATLFDIYLAARISRLSAMLGDPLAAELCRVCLPAATAMGDAPLVAELALRIVELDRRPDVRADALDALRAIATGSGYRIAAVERAVEREDGPLVPRSTRERAPSYPELFSRLLGFLPDALDFKQGSP